MDSVAPTPRRDALAAVLIGGLLLLSAWTMAATSTFSESATYCPSVLGRDVLTNAADEEFCAPILADRLRLVAVLAVTGLSLVVVGAVRSRSSLLRASPTPSGDVSSLVRFLLAVLGLVTVALSLPVVLASLAVGSSRELVDVFNSSFPVAAASASLAVAALASTIGRQGSRLTLDHAMTATSLAMPLMTLFVLDLDSEGVTRRAQIDPGWSLEGLIPFLSGVPVALALVLLAARQNRGRTAPPAAIGGLALLGSAAALFVAMTPEALTGGWGSGTDQSPGRFFLWLTVGIMIPWVASTTWWAAQATRPDAGPVPRQRTLA